MKKSKAVAEEREKNMLKNVSVNKTANWSYLNKKKKKPFIREVWSKEETELVETYFQKNIVREIVPGKSECEKCIKQHELLKGRSWVVLKCKVKNIITANKRKLNQPQS